MGNSDSKGKSLDSRLSANGGFGRREYLLASGTAITATLAGCSDSISSSDQSNGGNTSEKQQSIEQLRSELKRERSRVSELQQTIETRDERIEELEEKVEKSQGTRFSDDTIKQARTVGESLQSSVVSLYKETESGSAGGTGWFIDSTTIVSNGHVVSKSPGGEMFESMTAFLPDGTSFAVEPVAMAHESIDGVHVDMAVLSAERSGTPVRTGDESTLTEGQPLVQNGHPSDVGEWVTSLGEFLGFEKFRGVTSNVPTRSGNSGSPVATLDGKVVGLTASTFTEGPDTGTLSEPSPASDTVYTTPGYHDAITEITAHTPISTVKEFVADHT